MATPWRNCYASVALVDEVNKRFLSRDRASDGTIGDAAHATRTSDHNPWVILDGVGIVRARDVDKDGVDAAGLVEYLRSLGAQRDDRLYPGGYVIFNRRITAPDFSGWKTYTGSNPHTAHFHVSFSTVAAGFDSSRSWGIWPTTGATSEEFLMALTDAEQKELLAGVRALQKLKPGMVLPARSPNASPKQDDVFGSSLNAWAEAANARAAAERVEAFLKTFTGGTGAPLALTAADRTAIAADVANLLAVRLAQ